MKYCPQEFSYQDWKKKTWKAFKIIRQRYVLGSYAEMLPTRPQSVAHVILISMITSQLYALAAVLLIVEPQ